MFGFLREVRPSRLSAYILCLSYHYARALGVICFGISKKGPNDALVGRKNFRLKWYSLILRICCSAMVCCFCAPYVVVLEDPYEWVLECMRLVACLVCTTCILVLQVFHEHEVLRMINSFLRLFRRVRQMSARTKLGFGGKREFVLLLFKVICLGYELICECHNLLFTSSLLGRLTILCEIIVELGSLMIIHIGFVGYLSVAALYSEVNSYVRLELRRQLRSLERPGGAPASRRQLRIASGRLEECVAVYDEIERVGRSFHVLLELPVLIILMAKIFATTVLAYEVIIRSERYPSQAGMWGLVLKSFADVILLTLAAHEAVSSSRVIRRLSLENFSGSDHKEWHVKLEMFLSRLNVNEFRVRPLGLFEVSNEIILVFLSSMITYFTYVMQYGIQTNRL
ncbi:putative gustatory receptor 93c [Drosophila subobscura]|uniref:putative gustatory receptor 93c n=1 Tax=Drosophila subobscura TaxID=7241 RepID=UPI00155AE663|nr:putative gustatory receptor 93c [Drosophila subobscura]